MANARKYNPDYHQSIVNNFKRLYERCTDVPTLTLSDQEIYDLYEEWAIVDLGNDPQDHEEAAFAERFGQDAAVVLAMIEAQKEKS